ncbi:hypothetical protein JCM11251_004631 [Rhodosporidiobolus azoricus]
MPLLFSRRKSEANLRSSPPTSSIPSEPLPPFSPTFPKLVKGGKAQPVPRTSYGSLSRSVGRAEEKRRPDRVRGAGAQGVKGGKTVPPELPSGGGTGEWDLHDDVNGKRQLANATSRGTSTPITARFGAKTAGGHGYATPPRRDSSFASTVASVSSASAAFASSPANSSTSHLVASPSFFASSPPTSDGGHDGFLLDTPGISAKTFGSGREREQTPTSTSISQTFAAQGSPNSSFIAVEVSPALARLDRFDQLSQPAGLPPSSSFYTFNASVSPVPSPARSPAVRPESLMRRNGNASFPIVEMEEESDKIRDSLSRTRRAGDEGFESESFARKSTGTLEQISPPGAYKSPFPSPSAALALNALSSASNFQNLSSSTTRAAYNPLTAFFGTSSTKLTSPVISPSLSSSSLGTPAKGFGFSSSTSEDDAGNGSTTTPATSDGDEEEVEESPLVTPMDEKPFPLLLQPQPKKPVLEPPIQLEPASLRSQHPSKNNVATPTQPTFALPSFQQPEKAAVDSPPIQSSSPVRSFERTAVTQQKTSTDDSSARRDSLLANSEALDLSPKKPRPPPLAPGSFSPTLARPSQPGSVAASNAAPLSPRTPRSPTAPKSPRALPASCKFDHELVSSPKKKVTAEGTPRTLALKAARERRQREASEVSEEGKEAASQGQVSQVAEAIVSHKEETITAQKTAVSVEVIAQHDEPLPPRPRVEYAFSLFAPAPLRSVLPHISFDDLISLRQVSKSLQRSIDDEGEAKEVVLERFLGAQGYRRFALVSSASSKKRRAVVVPSDSITLDIRDLIAFRAGLALPPDTYARLARTYASFAPNHFSATSLKLARATTRAWNRVVLRLRSQSLLPAEAFAPPAFPALAPSPQPVYKTGRAVSLRVWVPLSSPDGWMSDAEVVECEREIWRAGNGAWAQMRQGDVVSNVACEVFGNVGKMVFDGRYLRDLAFTFDVVGHLPPWLNMLTFSPSYYHNIVVSSSSDPVFYLSLAPFIASVRETIQLCNDRVGLSSPQGTYVVRKFVYRAGIKIKSGQIIGTSAGSGGSGPGGIDVVHDDWTGQLVLETDGTTEHAAMLVARAASTEPTPWRIVRSKCRPGRLFLRPVLDSEAC